jgi:hypothetical protein
MARRQELLRRHGDLFVALMDIVNKQHPDQPGLPYDEFSMEVKAVMGRLDGISSEKQMGRVMREECPGESDAMYEGIAKDFWRVWKVEPKRRGA